MAGLSSGRRSGCDASLTLKGVWHERPYRLGSFGMAIDVAGAHWNHDSDYRADGSALCRETWAQQMALGHSAFLLVYLSIFWDWIPTLAVHKYYCDKDAGFWIYKTLDQWKAENPEVIETLVANKGAISKRQGNMDNYTETYALNERINKIIEQQLVLSWLPVNRRVQTVVDTKANEILARYVDFGSYDRDWDGLKFWLGIKGCNETKSEHDSLQLRMQFVELARQLTGRRN
jgi:hypothetical protein